MGDIVEFTTVAEQPIVSYKISAQAISFEVKAPSRAFMGLAQTPGSNWKFMVGFDTSGRILLKGDNGVKSVENLSYSLSDAQYKRFWISWHSGVLCVGQDRNPISIVSYPCNMTDVNYVMFSSSGTRIHTSWRLELPPAPSIKMMRTVPYKPVRGGELRWVQAGDQLPDDAVIGGFEGETLYIIRGPHSGSLTPGKFVPSEGMAYVSWGGAANIVPEFEILCGYNFTWQRTQEDLIPFDAFVAGHSEVNNEKLYIGRVVDSMCVIPGKVQPSHKVCYVALDDKEKSYKDYEILTVPDSNPYAAGDYFLINRNNVLRHYMHEAPINLEQNDVEVYDVAYDPNDFDEEDELESD